MPTGNFGDVYAGYVASRMGLAIDRLVVATNVNDILARAFATGAYEIKDVVATTSPSMDIQVSSNFERLLFDTYGRDAKAIRALMGSLAQSRRFAIASPALKELRALFTADRASEEECAATMRATMREAGYCVDPHTAVGLAGRREGSAQSGGADGGAVDRASGEIPRRGRRRLRHAPGAAGMVVRSDDPAGAVQRAAGRPVGGRAVCCVGFACRA